MTHVMWIAPKFILRSKSQIWFQGSSHFYIGSFIRSNCIYNQSNWIWASRNDILFFINNLCADVVVLWCGCLDFYIFCVNVVQFLRALVFRLFLLVVYQLSKKSRMKLLNLQHSLIHQNFKEQFFFMDWLKISGDEQWRNPNSKLIRLLNISFFIWTYK